MISLPSRKKGGIVGTMGSSSIPLANWPNPMAQTGPGPKVNRPRNTRATFRLGTTGSGMPERSFARVQPTQERPGDLSPWYQGASYPKYLLSRCAQVPGCPFTRMLPFPIGNFTKNCQPAFHDISKCSTKNQSPRLQRNSKATAARSGNQLHKKKNKSSFPK